ncbi:MAG: hypothetical protein LQ343_006192 [Gyalolechia ehrenbergii]|nr:MAG: hypothetical protein LQ343_006192 [Gyalolechia ehrenbergii]
MSKYASAPFKVVERLLAKADGDETLANEHELLTRSSAVSVSIGFLPLALNARREVREAVQELLEGARWIAEEATGGGEVTAGECPLLSKKCEHLKGDEKGWAIE